MATEKKTPAKKSPKKPAAKSTAAGKVTPKKTPLKPAAKAAAKSADAKKTPAKKPMAKKPMAKKPSAKKAAPKVAAPVEEAPKVAPVAEVAAPVPTPAPTPAPAPAPASVVGKPKYPVVRPGASKKNAEATIKASEQERYSDAELEEFEALLRAKRDEVLRQVKGIREDALKHNDEENVEEDGTNSFIRTANLQLAEKQQATINAVQDALRAIKEKTYGICQTCGCKIPRERLQARPYAIRCVTCKTKYERDIELSRRQSQNGSNS